MFKPELLSPAGTLQNMRYAFAYGADAVYAGQPRYCACNNEFNHENLQLGINEAHALAKILRGGQHRAAQRQAEDVHS
jgi:putative protease